MRYTVLGTCKGLAMNSATQPTNIPIPAEVYAFAAEQGVSAELPAVLGLTRRLFPVADLSVQVEEDPEIAILLWRLVTSIYPCPKLWTQRTSGIAAYSNAARDYGGATIRVPQEVMAAANPHDGKPSALERLNHLWPGQHW